jgi:hypothetical protein
MEHGAHSRFESARQQLHIESYHLLRGKKLGWYMEPLLVFAILVLGYRQIVMMLEEECSILRTRRLGFRVISTL